MDKIICLGDIIAKGIHPQECIKLIKERCDIVIQGNTDEYFSNKHENMSDLPEQEQKRIKWNHSLITEEDREYLLNLPFSYEFYMSGSLVRLFHATDKANNKVVLNIDDIETKYEMFCQVNILNRIMLQMLLYMVIFIIHIWTKYIIRR